MNYARRQQYRRFSRGVRWGLTSAAVALVGLFVLRNGFGLVGGVLLALTVVLGLRARHWLSLAEWSRVGARSEDQVRRAPALLQDDGWRLRHALPWRWRGDIDSVAIAPGGVGLVIETKSRTYDERHLERVLEQARWRRRRRWCRARALAVLCVVRAAGVERYEGGVLVVSIDRLVPVLRGVAIEFERGRSAGLGGRLAA